jgi:hypothetical protein
MTEEEWLASDDPETIYRRINTGEKPSLRKSHLFGVACCHRVSHLIDDERLRQVLETLARHAESPETVPPEEDEQLRQIAYRLVGPSAVRQQRDAASAARWAVLNVAQGIDGAAAWHAATAIARVHGRNQLDPAERKTQSFLLRCIFGNPFRPVALDPSWRTSTVVALAEGIYADRAFDRLPILADALQDAGCGNESVLSHCRSGGPHARGCWVVDLLLGKK